MSPPEDSSGDPRIPGPRDTGEWLVFSGSIDLSLLLQALHGGGGAHHRKEHPALAWLATDYQAGVLIPIGELGLDTELGKQFSLRKTDYMR